MIKTMKFLLNYLEKCCLFLYYPTKLNSGTYVFEYDIEKTDFSTNVSYIKFSKRE